MEEVGCQLRSQLLNYFCSRYQYIEECTILNLL